MDVAGSIRLRVFAWMLALMAPTLMVRLGPSPALQMPAATVGVEDALKRALADEYRARDAYRAVIARHGEVRPFSNIVQAEERHIAALVRVCESMGYSVPADSDDGSATAPASVAEACRAAVAGERANIALYDELLPLVVGHPQVERTFRQLQSASKDRHLPAFERCAERPAGGAGKGMK